MEYLTAVGKPSDLKVCSAGHLNWYDNDVCINSDCSCEEFDVRHESVVKNIKGDYEFYENEEYKEDEIDHILIEV